MYVPFQAIQKYNEKYYLSQYYMDDEYKEKIFNGWCIEDGRAIFEINFDWREKLHYTENNTILKINNFKDYILSKIHETELYWTKFCLPIDINIQIQEGMSSNQIKFVIHEKDKSHYIKWIDKTNIKNFIEKQKGNAFYYQFCESEYRVFIL